MIPQDDKGGWYKTCFIGLDAVERHMGGPHSPLREVSSGKELYPPRSSWRHCRGGMLKWWFRRKKSQDFMEAVI